MCFLRSGQVKVARLLARTLLIAPGAIPISNEERRMKPSTKARVKKLPTAKSRRNEFLLARLGKGCWVVGYQGRVIAGAVLSSLPAAAAYAADLAHAFGSHNFFLTVVEAGRNVV
jgi:hypothetical protein